MSSLLAVSFQETGKVSFYNLVLFVHITAAIVAFGVTFAYPILHAALQAGNVRSAPYLHRVQGEIGAKLITPAAIIVLAAGIYVTSEGPYDFGDAFVGGGIAIVVILLGLGGAFFARKERRMAELAEQAVAAAGEGEVVLDEEYHRLNRQLSLVGMLSSALVVVAVFLMVVKPGA